MDKKPKCSFCNSKKWVNTMIKFMGENWFLCSKCGGHNFDNIWKKQKGV